MPAPPLPELLLPDPATWREWLIANHAASPGVWLVLGKKGGNVTTVAYESAVLEALCVGWIDGQAKSRDAATSLQRYTPRRPRSRWSAKNVERVARLEAEGKMLPAGRAAVEEAKADGRWEAAYAGPASAVVPEDLTAAIAANPDAQAMFEVLTSQNRFALIYRIENVKRAETRERKITEFVAMLARHETLHPQKRMPTD
ncbi:YdeI/OmpD-associated family protein [Ruania suaedae]|uniref:YdeI/OmpD-associated family protein n=1 Tax=Ruania suaedae TaxID=2897774 RepID=UPI001E3DB1C3|nr:YdeI/OmpD-associated family protein [Ruania suaedae]UFU02961.1 YdeI/OmpD-associated family protein [Ruania suaedae]